MNMQFMLIVFQINRYRGKNGIKSNKLDPMEMSGSGSGVQ